MSTNEELPKDSFGQKNALFIKLTFIAFVTLLLLIPSAMINNLISERKNTKFEAISEIGEKWGKEQTIIGPVLTIPFKKITKIRNTENSTEEFIERIHQIHILPESLSINSKIIPQRLYRGIFEVAVYDSQTAFKGSFSAFDPLSLGVQPHELMLDQAFISIGISDMRGIQNQVEMNFGTEESLFLSGAEVHDKELIPSGIHAPVTLSLNEKKTPNSEFSFDLNLKGSDHIYFTPVGKNTNAQVTSSWSSPSFNGEYLPEIDGKTVSGDGFKASWNIIDLNRNFPQNWTNQKQDIKAASFGVDLFIPADNYQRTERSIKYAILFISLTFLVFFFVEIMNNKSVHPVQYILVGLALCLFYTLLLAISEHSSFNIAYLFASILTLIAVAGYCHSILRNNQFTLLLSGVLAVLYGFIFVIIQLEDLALLAGSFGLFIILSLVMFFSRKIDWYSINQAIRI